MSSKKDKLLESAQKFILKGQLDRAIKDYRQIVALDSEDIRHRQRLAELLVRDNCKKEAIVEFEQVGKYFSGNDYYLKAIAVYKQIQKLDPGNLAVSLILASLNYKQGLNGNALNEYSGVVAEYEKSGEYDEALKTVERMLEIDPGNLFTLFKKGEVLFSSGDRDKAFQVFSELLHLLTQNEDKATLAKVAERVSELYPGRELFPVGQSRIDSTDFTTEGLESAAKSRTQDDTIQDEPLDFFEAEFPGETETTSVVAADIAGPLEPDSFSATPGNTVEPESWEEDIEIELSDDIGLQQFLSPENNENTVTGPASAEETSAIYAELDFPAGERLDFDFSFAPETTAAAVDSDDMALYNHSAETSSAHQSGIDQASGDYPFSALEVTTEAPLAEDFFDQLDALPVDGTDPDSASGGVGNPDFAEMFTILQKETAESPDEHELESRYDLGIAYKEMGLYDEAINEFKAAAQGPRRIDCITLQANCFRDKGMLETAEKLLAFGIAMEGVSTVGILNLKYELAFLYETAGRLEEALAVYGEVFDVNPGFHNVAQKIASLKGGDEEQDIIDLEMDDIPEC